MEFETRLDHKRPCQKQKEGERKKGRREEEVKEKRELYKSKGMWRTVLKEPLKVAISVNVP